MGEILGHSLGQLYSSGSYESKGDKVGIPAELVAFVEFVVGRDKRMREADNYSPVLWRAKGNFLPIAFCVAKKGEIFFWRQGIQITFYRPRVFMKVVDKKIV